MTEEEIRAAIREHAVTIFELEPEELGDDDDFEALGGTSLQRLELVTVLRDQLGAHYSPDDEVQITSVRTAVDITRRVLTS